MAERNPIVYVNGYPREIAGTDRVKNTGITRSGTAPSNPQDKDAWLDTSSGQLKVYQSGAWHSPNYLTSVNTDLVYDTTPQLGGNLDVNGRTITSANDGNIVLDPHGTGSIEVGAALTTSSNADIVLDPHGTGNIEVGATLTTSSNGDIVLDPHGSGNIVVAAPIKTNSNGDINLDPNGSGDVVIMGNSTRGAGAIQLNCEFNSHGIKLKSPPHSANASYTLTFPNDAGTNGYALTTNGSGVLSWTEQVPDSSITSAKLANDITIAGNLTVNGTTTTVNSTTLTVDDKNIELGSVSSPSDTTADGGGITLKGASDKTITWVNSTDCWTFNQSVNLTAGTAAVPGLILNGDVNTGFFQSAADELAISTAGTERLRVGSAGQVGVAGANYGTSGQVLTSGGASGAVSWADATGGGTVELTASGALSDGDPVLLNSDGTVKSVAVTNVNFSASSEQVLMNDEHHSHVGVCPIPGTRNFALAYRDNSNNNYSTVVIGTINSDNTVTYGTPLVFNSSVRINHRCYWDVGSGRLVVVDFDGYAYAFTVAVSGRTISGLSNGQTSQGTGSARRIDVYYNATAGKGVIIFFKNTTSGGALRAWTMSVNTTYNTVQFSSYDDAGLQSCSDTCCSGYDSGADKYVIFARRTDYYRYKYSLTINSSGNPSFGSAVQMTGTDPTSFREGNFIYDTEHSKFFYLDDGGGSGGNRYTNIHEITYSGSTVNLSSPVTFTTADPWGIYHTKYVYNTQLNKTTGFIRSNNDADLGVAELDYDGTNWSISGQTYNLSGTGREIYFDKLGQGQAYLPDANVSIIAYYSRNSSDNGNLKSSVTVVQNSGSVSNLEADKFVGISNGAYADGASATIQILGSVDDAQSGMTIGSKYYVQEDGSLGTTAASPSVFAGTALTATKLLIKGTL